MKRIIAIHLLNDRSGSPNVLRQSLEVLKDTGFAIELVTSPSEGFLSDMEGVKYHHVPYSYQSSRTKVLIHYLFAQLLTFLKVFKIAKKGDTVYINSMLPFGGALAARLKGAMVVYHIHEISLKPKLLKSFLKSVVNLFAHKAIFVSRFLKNELDLKVANQQVIYNALSEDFTKLAMRNSYRFPENFTVLMVCSLKDFKGIPEFIKVAHQLPEIKFDLVLNANSKEINDYFDEYKLTKNVTIYPAQKKVNAFYKKADLVVNLSRTDEWLETFGMTVLEGMYYAKPCIVPTRGGASELIKDGFNGFQIDGRNIKRIVKTIRDLANNPLLHASMSTKSRKIAQDFNSNIFQAKISYCFLSLSELSTKTAKSLNEGQVSISWNKAHTQNGPFDK